MAKKISKASTTLINQLYDLTDKSQRWLIVIDADPDSIGAAIALKRILNRRVEEISIARINEVTRPDNLALLRCLRLKMPLLTNELKAQYDHFAILDSQPCHNVAFGDIKFSVVIDHHPKTDLCPSITSDALVDVRPEYGTTSTMLLSYLNAAGIQPSTIMATSLLYGIRTDTANFSRQTSSADLRALSSLVRVADHNKLSLITRSEFLLPWLRIFLRGIEGMQSIGTGRMAFLGKVPTTDILPVTADFLNHIHELRWAAVAGVYQHKLVVSLRSDGMRNVGDMAAKAFSEWGTAGGHKTMARAEIPLDALTCDDIEEFLIKRLKYALINKNGHNNHKTNPDSDHRGHGEHNE